MLSGLLLFIVCWGGTFATISYELDWLFNPDLQVQAIGEAGSLEDIYQRVNLLPKPMLITGGQL